MCLCLPKPTPYVLTWTPHESLWKCGHNLRLVPPLERPPLFLNSGQAHFPSPCSGIGRPLQHNDAFRPRGKQPPSHLPMGAGIRMGGQGTNRIEQGAAELETLNERPEVPGRQLWVESLPVGARRTGSGIEQLCAECCNRYPMSCPCRDLECDLRR